mmetsp:Transcript_10944/g.26319  ORF Transcript_10944/g.26319 Transcript_10944/m.26319 type:complete len:845 (+) Transcript_10944:95-2629(+)
MQVAGYPGDGTEPVVGGRHPLLEKETFEQLHRNDVVETRPHTLHFGGFKIHKEHTQMLRVVNISPSSLRVSIIGPSTQWFRINFDKKGLLAPGMSEDITVSFEPHEWRYYYDTIKIFCGELSENLIVPIHAYPSANDLVLPRIIDFGCVAIGTSRSKVIPLSCKIPIQFEFEISVVESHSDFDISPLVGVIPADGSTEVVVTFTPSRHRTARAELQFHIAQFDFQPVQVTILGSCSPEAAKLEVLRAEMIELEAAETKKKQEAFAETTRKLQGRSKAPLQVVLPTFKKEELERNINGVKVPTTRTDQQATNYILNQTAGKLPLKDLVAFIREQRQVADQRRRLVSDNFQNQEDEVVEEDKQAQELRFELQYREVDKRDKDKELKSTRATGEEPPAPEVLSEVSAARKRRHEKIHQYRVGQDIKRVESVLSQTKIAVPSNFKPALKPEWDECANDTFSVRLQVIERFVRAGSKVLMRVRAEKRARLLWEAMNDAGVFDRPSCKAWVEAENKAAASGTLIKNEKIPPKPAKGTENESEGSIPSVHIPTDFVLPFQTPTRTSGFSAEERQPVEVVQLENFEEFLPMELNKRLDYKVLDYRHYQVPPASAYMQPNAGRVRFSAALEENLILGARGDELDGAELPLPMPDSCLLPPAHDALSLLIPSTECRTYVAYPDSAECDPEFGLAEKPELLMPLAAEPLLPPGIMSLESLWLETWRAPRQLEDPFQHGDPFPCSFAEAGGSLGPGLGADLGGMRLSYKPVGGLGNDLPSDTDDDEQPELQVPAPGKDLQSKAINSLDMDVNSALWYKQGTAEDQLKKLCADNGCAVRDKLSSLNHDVNSGKLYLG